MLRISMLLRFAIIALILSVPVRGANAFYHGCCATPSLARSQLNPNFLYTGERITINLMKLAQSWTYGDNSGAPTPLELNSNGYPLASSSGIVTHHGDYVLVQTPSQFERPGNYVTLATGQGTSGLSNDFGGSTLAACTGTISGPACTTSSCTDLTGSISGQTMTVTAASSCSLVLYQPISGSGVTVNLFGVPTMITGMSGSSNCPSCTGTGGTGTYLVNWSQSIGSETLIPGLYSEATPSSEVTTSNGEWKVSVTATGSGSTQIDNMALVHKSDLALYASGQLTGVLFKQRAAQGNFATIRDLNTALTNVTNVTTWETRKPSSYYSYQSPEWRSSLWAGTTTYALNGSSNDYAVNLGASLPVDKQTICIQWSTSATNATVTFSIDGGTTKYPVLDIHGSTLTFAQPAANGMDGLVFDAFTGKWISTLDDGQARSCLNSGMPPEAFLQINSEMGTNPWLVEPYLASDPITDYSIQYALHAHSTFPNMHPEWETPDELWNCTQLGSYASYKSRAYMAVDATWASNASGNFCGPSGDNINFIGKAGSLLGQALRSAGINDPIIEGIQLFYQASSNWKAMLLSSSYVGQNPADIPTQSGCAGPGAIQTYCPAPFLQQASYKTVSDVTISNYWNPIATGSQSEVALAYCYFYQSAGCASQSSLMTTYFLTNTINNNGQTDELQLAYPAWFAYAQTCAGGSGCTPLTIRPYEGGYSIVDGITSDVTIAVTSATNANPAVLTANGNGAFIGMTVSLTAASGGTWSTVVGNSYTVIAVTLNTITISLDSTSLGTLSSATLDYTNSADYISYFRVMSHLAPDLDTWTTVSYNGIASPTGWCAPSSCGISPSQFNFASGFSSNSFSWEVWSFDLYGYAKVASCTLCTISGTSLTLGGTVKGIFASGLTVLGGGISGPTITGACTQTGSGPAGSNAGDVCPLSASFTVSSGSAMTANITPPNNQAGNSTTSPVRSWGAICRFNGNGNQCNGWLLKRDIDPASNDNDPMWLDKAA